MKKHAFKAAGVGLLAGLGLLFGGASAAGADIVPQTSASSGMGDGVGTGNSIDANLAAPIEVECNGTGVGGVGLGAGHSLCVDDPDMVTQTAASSGQGDGVIAGNSIALNAAMPIDIACNLTGIGGVGVGLGSSTCV